MNTMQYFSINLVSLELFLHFIRIKELATVIRKICEIFLTRDIFHTCVAARIVEEQSSQRCVRGYHVYQDVWDATIAI